MTGHPDGKVGHDPPRTVFGKYGHATSRLPVPRPQMRGDATRLAGGLGPSPIADLSSAVGLREEDMVCRLPFPPVKTLQGQTLVSQGQLHVKPPETQGL